MLLGWWSLSPQSSYSQYVFFPCSFLFQLGKGRTIRGSANLERDLFGGCCALLGSPPALSVLCGRGMSLHRQH